MGRGAVVGGARRLGGLVDGQHLDAASERLLDQMAGAAAEIQERSTQGNRARDLVEQRFSVDLGEIQVLEGGVARPPVPVTADVFGPPLQRPLAELAVVWRAAHCFTPWRAAWSFRQRSSPPPPSRRNCSWPPQA